MRNYRADRSIYLSMKVFAGFLIATLLVAQQSTPLRQSTPLAAGAQQSTPLAPGRSAEHALGCRVPATLRSRLRHRPTIRSAAVDSPEDAARIDGITVRIVMAPVTVTDRAGNIVDGLTPSDFRLVRQQQAAKSDRGRDVPSVVAGGRDSGECARWKKFFRRFRSWVRCCRRRCSATTARRRFWNSITASRR